MVKKNIKIEKIVKKPTVSIRKLNAVRSAMKGGANTRFTTPGKEGNMDVDQMIQNEGNRFLGRYSL